MKSWRDRTVERLERFCGLNPTAIGVGQKIDRASNAWWRNRAAETQKDADSPKPNPLDGTRLWDNS